MATSSSVTPPMRSRLTEKRTDRPLKVDNHRDQNQETAPRVVAKHHLAHGTETRVEAKVEERKRDVEFRAARGMGTEEREQGRSGAHGVLEERRAPPRGGRGGRRHWAAGRWGEGGAGRARRERAGKGKNRLPKVGELGEGRFLNDRAGLSRGEFEDGTGTGKRM